MYNGMDNVSLPASAAESTYHEGAVVGEAADTVTYPTDSQLQMG